MAEFRRRRAKLRVKAEEIDYKNVELLKRFVSDKGKINPSRLNRYYSRAKICPIYSVFEPWAYNSG